MNDDDISEDEFAAWNSSMRNRVISYLEGEGIDSPEVGDWPAFEIAPKFGIWCVESKKHPGKIGWWVFAGDCPTDYVSEDGQCHPRAALTNLVKRWADCVPHMKNGKQPSLRASNLATDLTSKSLVIFSREESVF